MRWPAVFAWETFDDLLRKGLKVWLFYLTVLFFFRLFFLGWMQEYMGAGTGAADVFAAVVRGTRLSCQTAGALTLVEPAGTFALNSSPSCRAHSRTISCRG